jgi:uncharacterized membrane protein YkvA (DUF1232 family)
MIGVIWRVRMMNLKMSNQTAKSKIRTIDPACWPTSHPTQYEVPEPRKPRQFRLEPLPRFPHSLFQFKTYDGAKALTAAFLLLSTVYLLAGFLGFLIDHTVWLHDLFYPKSVANSSVHSSGWKFWQSFGSVLQYLSSYIDLAIRVFLFVCSYCLAWATFDPRNIEGYIMGCFNALLGIIYLLTPIDMIPDIVPVVGNLDDTVLGCGVLLLGLSGIYRNKFRDVKTNTILELIDDGNNQKALTMLLEDKGIAIRKKA